MKLSSLVTALLLLAAAGTAAAQTDPRSQDAAEAAADDGKVNPMTGKLLSEERLTRHLGAQKLTTSIIQEQVKQAELKNQLGLASSRRALEEARLRNESGNLAAGGRRGSDVGLRDSLGSRERAITPKSQTPAMANAPMPVVQTPPPPPSPVASGSIKIGDDTLNVTARYAGPDARINFVDAQTRPAQALPAMPQTPTAAAPSGTFIPAVAGPAGGSPIQLVPSANR